MFPTIIIGTGLAGYQLAREFRRLDTTSPLLLITADNGQFYPKPQLSTALTQKKTAATLVTATAETMATQLPATILTHTTITQIDAEKQIIYAGQQTWSYKNLILACGADVIRPPLTGDAIQEVLSINHIYHYATFAELIQDKKHLTILGAGLIGCEFANDLSNAGYEVHMTAPDKTPLNIFIPEEVGKILQTALEKNGVHFHLQCLAKQIDKTARGYRLILSNGEILETEFILSAIGLVPHTQLAKTIPVKINRGIIVNRFLETSVKNIYALGDCAEVEGHVLPFITPILNCARALAKTLTQERTAVDYPAMPVTVKTPVHPIALCPPPKNMLGQWQIENKNNNIRALFYNTEKQLYGFVLTNDAVKEKMELAKCIPPFF